MQFVCENMWAPLAKVPQVGRLHVEMHMFILAGLVCVCVCVCENAQASIAGEMPMVNLVRVLRSSEGPGGSHCAVCL